MDVGNIGWAVSRIAVCVWVGVTALAGCQPGGSDRPHVNLDANIEALRAAFNADSGKVRVVMLVAPT
jgi:hypothetical protein